MADINLPTLMFRLRPNDDPELTCLICYPTDRKPCEYVFVLRATSSTLCIGCHKRCVEAASRRNQVHDERLEREIVELKARLTLFGDDTDPGHDELLVVDSDEKEPGS